MGQPTRYLSHSSLLVGKWVVIHVITWIKSVETIKRQTRAVWLQACVCRIRLQPIGCTPALSVTQSAAAAAVHRLWRYIKCQAFYLYLKSLCIPCPGWCRCRPWEAGHSDRRPEHRRTSRDVLRQSATVCHQVSPGQYWMTMTPAWTETRKFFYNRQATLHIFITTLVTIITTTQWQFIYLFIYKAQ